MAAHQFWRGAGQAAPPASPYLAGATAQGTLSSASYPLPRTGPAAHLPAAHSRQVYSISPGHGRGGEEVGPSCGKWG